MTSFTDTLLASPMPFVIAGAVLLTALLFTLRRYFFGTGYVSAFKYVRVDDATSLIFLAEECLTYEGESDTEANYYRLFILNAGNGVRVFREVIQDSFALYNQRGPVLFYKQGNGFRLHDMKEAHIKAIFDHQTLPVLFPELSSGIQAFEYASSNACIVVRAKNGRQYWIEPFDQKISDREPVPKSKPYRDGDAIVVKETAQGPRVLIRLAGERENDRIKKLTSNSYQLLNPELSFLDGRCLQVFANSNQFVVLHYKNTDNKEFILSCVSFEAELCWRLNQNDLEVGKSGTLDLSAAYKEHLIITVGGFVCAISMANGSVVWKKRV